jgi:hypothetical protein
MKKILILMLILGIMSFVNAQNIIQINQSSNSTSTNSSNSNCDFKINGVCSSEDIGGVSLERFYNEIIPGQENAPWPNYYGYAELTNYNNFTVTVLIKVAFEFRDSYQEETYQVVIPRNETRKVKIKKGNCPGCYSLLGMIVRRLKN